MNVNSATAMGQVAYLNYTTAAKNNTFSSMTSSNDVANQLQESLDFH
jgi:tripartite-type tricarboxylate transporter receptor subunit TctC